MAPEIALDGLKDLPSNYKILDPMSGSGMVLGTASKLGLSSIGFDLDPLACMISRVNGTRITPSKVRNAMHELLKRCQNSKPNCVTLPWIDKDYETQKYVDFWFAPKQQLQLRALSYFLVAEPFLSNRNVLGILKTAVSRLIITKEPKASLARDTAHSRPHRTIVDNDFDILGSLPNSLEHVLKALRPEQIVEPAKVYRGDARKMKRVSDCSIDCVITSPPYLNAIDYMRGHRLSLVWFGYTASQLRTIRSRSVGAEIVDNDSDKNLLREFFDELPEEIGNTKIRMLKRYYKDLCCLTREASRVLKSGKFATYVIGNSTVKGHEIRNSELLVLAADNVGLRVAKTSVRAIPENRRYMPLMNSETTNLSKRMRTEHVIVFEKTVA